MITCACQKHELRNPSAILDINPYDPVLPWEVHYLDECAVWRASRNGGPTVRCILAQRTIAEADAILAEYLDKAAIANRA